MEKRAAGRAQGVSQNTSMGSLIFTNALTCVYLSKLSASVVLQRETLNFGVPIDNGQTISRLAIE
jgi:hypothetical protein